MEVTGKASLKIMKNSPFDHVAVQLENLDLQQIKLQLTPMEARCNHCNVSFNATKEDVPQKILVLTTAVPLGENAYELNKNMFFVHEACMEEFIPAFLNPPSTDADEEEIKVVDMAEVVKAK